MTIHHLITISLLLFSFTNNFLRIGTLVLVVHDAADSLLAVSKNIGQSNEVTNHVHIWWLWSWVEIFLIKEKSLLCKIRNILKLQYLTTFFWKWPFVKLKKKCLDFRAEKNALLKGNPPLLLNKERLHPANCYVIMNQPLGSQEWHV